jgi:GNAT superfamily N-acetyltransferase
VTATEFDPPSGAFLVAYLDHDPVGCAGWRSHGDSGDTAELKRLYVAPTARGHGIARALLAAIERSAREYGRSRLILECGDRQPEAIGLYQGSGYELIENFGYYRDEPGVLSFGRSL